MNGRDWLICCAIILAVMILMVILITGSTFVPSSAVKGI